MIMQRGKSISILNALNSPAIYIPYNIYTIGMYDLHGMLGAAVRRLCWNMRAALCFTAKFNLKRAYVAPARNRLAGLSHTHKHTLAHTQNIARRAVQRNDPGPD